MLKHTFWTKANREVKGKNLWKKVMGVELDWDITSKSQFLFIKTSSLNSKRYKKEYGTLKIVFQRKIQ